MAVPKVGRFEYGLAHLGISINGGYPIAGWFIMVYFMENPNPNWMITRGASMKAPIGEVAVPEAGRLKHGDAEFEKSFHFNLF